MSTNHEVLIVAGGGGIPRGMPDALEAAGARVSQLDLEEGAEPGTSTRKLAKYLVDHGTPTALVNVLHSREAGVRAERVSNAAFQRAVDDNLTRTLVTCQEVGRAMLDAGGGAIVFVLAGASDDPVANVTDAAAMGLMRVLSVEWATHGVRVVAASPAGAPGTARDAATTEAVTFLISGDASYVTGTAVTVGAAVSGMAEAS